MANVLGISAFYHDSAATIAIDGKIVAAVQEERFSRIKNDAKFPVNAIKYCLQYSGLKLNQIDHIVYYEKPFLKLERLLETYLETAPNGFQQFTQAVPLWIKEKVLIKNKIRENLNLIEENFSAKEILFCEHHLSHAASALYTSPFSNAAIITADGVGEWCTTSIMNGTPNTITSLKELNFPHSIGLLYSAFTQFLGFKVNSGEYKVMGLAPYGNKNSSQFSFFKNKISELFDLKSDGSVFLNIRYFNFQKGLSMINENLWAELFEIKPRIAESEINLNHCHLALAIQTITEDVIFNLAKQAKQITNADNLCLAGGVALNCVAVGKLNKQNIFNKIYIQPASGDAGGAIGAALAIEHIFLGNKRKTPEKDHLQGCRLGPAYDNQTVAQSLTKYNLHFEQFKEEELLKLTATHLSNNKTVAWFQGRMEFGPRALGSRSILANPSTSNIQQTLNQKIKKRESFRPFAPAMLIEDYLEFYEGGNENGFMSMTDFLKKEKRMGNDSTPEEAGITEQLQKSKSAIQGVTHVDYSSRIQVVTETDDSLFFKLLTEYKKITGRGILINTSFNLRGQPIVCNPDDACKCFLETEIDLLAINNFIVRKK
ncbi:MAG TPA: carbamoyltransferase N-terminal domain-containing protein [Bacteroidia bacterium]|nr:carbamoyltransferase N-terminal domain-containing protein [Bacteroidia bacterium]HRE23881.1 carbamoyltransferase N-terminal domain-containing protein [Bacteroidia bacterium]